MTSRALLLAVMALAGCEKVDPPRQRAPIDHTARIESTLQVQGGRLHVVLIPGDAFDDRRCLLFVSESGPHALACIPDQIRFDE